MARRPIEKATHLTEPLELVLQAVKAGKTNKEIAAIRGVSEQYVKRQVTALLRRFGVESRTELIHIVYETELRAARSAESEEVIDQRAENDAP